MIAQHVLGLGKPNYSPPVRKSPENVGIGDRLTPGGRFTLARESPASRVRGDRGEGLSAGHHGCSERLRTLRSVRSPRELIPDELHFPGG